MRRGSPLRGKLTWGSMGRISSVADLNETSPIAAAAPEIDSSELDPHVRSTFLSPLRELAIELP